VPDPGVGQVVAAAPTKRTGTAEFGVADVAAAHGVSVRTLQRLFRAHVGVTPKWVLQRYRLHEAAERIAFGEATDLAALAQDLGYFDQAHFGNDFRRYVGVPPTAYAA
jgi:AraC-like DNA-binding protein